MGETDREYVERELAELLPYKIKTRERRESKPHLFSARSKMFLCQDCGLHSEFFMVRDEVWVEAAGLPKRDCIVCWSCLESRLERKLTIQDITGAPVNEGILRGFMLGAGVQE